MNLQWKIFSRIVAVVLSCGVALMACVKKDLAMSTEPIVLGAVYSLTGDKSDMGEPSSKGARLAVEQVNNRGGIDGRQVRLILEDSKSDPATTRQAVEAIINDDNGIPALFGLSDSDLAQAAGEAAAEKHRVFLTSGATSPLLPTQVPDYLYLACFGDNVQAAAAAEWAYRALDSRTVAVVYDSTETYTTLLHKYFIDRFQSLGGRVLAIQKYDPADMSKIGQDLPQVALVFLATGNAEDAQKGIQKLRASGITVPIVGGDGYDSEDAWEAHPEMRDIYYTTHVYLGDDNPDVRVQNFRAAYHLTYGGNPPDAFAALSYDAVNLLAEAITRAGTASPDAVRHALARIDGFQGVTGTISFVGGRQIPHKPVTIIEVKNGQRVLVKSFMPDVIPRP
ncbi:ABC transporter substrate-binding protein [Desulfopila sp. IMCC35006]|uniref:ABC transporter substrate-binding protein n=1 Tax=Desulfopila sp. IMCC35006 TaxID=2569542 RepID=UPI0010ADA1B6|nr:ABC transporter substrate-binding protein [Desulfopila sp. IMCC35006]TKB25882.1 ABC transporter substrate-binding protein [Desulfopila sp. IMCC35006]